MYKTDPDIDANIDYIYNTKLENISSRYIKNIQRDLI
jgi:hypothetical protein